jgi:two-component system LytT family response regulator
MGIRALIVDDEPLGREAIRSLLSRDPQVTHILEACNGREALAHLEASHADVVFLDVQMPDMDGMSVLGGIDPIKLPTIVFVTAHEHYAMEAFNRNAVDYLLKPVGSERFRIALEKAKAQLRARALGIEEYVSPAERSSAARWVPLRQIAVKWQQKIVFIATDTIGWICAADDYVEIHATGRRYLLHATLNKFAAKLDPKSFLRVHRSVVVNLSAVKEITPSTQGEFDIALQDGTVLRSGRTYGEVMRRLLSNTL